MNKLKKLSYANKILLSAALLVILIVAGNNWRINQRYTVIHGSQNNGLGTTYGYGVENYLFTDNMRITLWVKYIDGYVMKSIYELSELTVDKVDANEWIKSNGAIYLALQITYHDSLVSTNPTRIIYDFHRGEMYVTSDLTLWRFWSRDLDVDTWMSESEFEKILSGLR